MTDRLLVGLARLREAWRVLRGRSGTVPFDDSRVVVSVTLRGACHSLAMPTDADADTTARRMAAAVRRHVSRSLGGHDYA